MLTTRSVLMFFFLNRIDSLLKNFHSVFFDLIFNQSLYVQHKEKKTVGKKGRASKQKLLKDCHQGQSVTVAANLQRVEFKNFSCRSTMEASNTFRCSMAPFL